MGSKSEMRILQDRAEVGEEEEDLLCDEGPSSRSLPQEGRKGRRKAGGAGGGGGGLGGSVRTRT